MVPIDLPYPKGKKICHQRRYYLRVWIMGNWNAPLKMFLSHCAELRTSIIRLGWRTSYSTWCPSICHLRPLLWARTWRDFSFLRTVRHVHTIKCFFTPSISGSNLSFKKDFCLSGMLMPNYFEKLHYHSAHQSAIYDLFYGRELGEISLSYAP